MHACCALQAANAKYVLRKKPPGRVLASAHAVEREFRVLAALRETPVPVPAALCLCEDASVLGTPFYVMAHVQVRSLEVLLCRKWAMPGLPLVRLTAHDQTLCRWANGEHQAALRLLAMRPYAVCSSSQLTKANTSKVKGQLTCRPPLT